MVDDDVMQEEELRSQAADPSLKSKDDDFHPFAYLLVELKSLDGLINFASCSSKRVKFTCTTASSRLLVLGTSSGTGYAFSRFLPKIRSPSPSNTVPHMDMFSFKDGAINCLCVSPSESLIAVGSDSGRLSVATIASEGKPTAVNYSVPGDARNPDKVTSLVWTADSSSLYVGHDSGAVYLHKITSRSLFRSSSHELLCTLKGSIVQMDLNGERLLISTTTATFIYNIETATVKQVGTKLRNCRMGACFLGSMTSVGGASSSCEYIVAARPTGRMWEANSEGIVYRTHQFRQSNGIPRHGVVSFRTSFTGSQLVEDDGLQTDVNGDVEMQSLHRITVDDSTLVLSWIGSRLLIFDTESSRVLLISDLKEDIVDVSVCGSDVFVLFASSPHLCKYTLFNRKKAVERLQNIGCHSQAAQLIMFTSPRVHWNDEVIKSCIESLADSTKKRGLKRLRSGLAELLEHKSDVIGQSRENSLSVYDNCDSPSTSVPSAPPPLPPHSSSRRLPSGVHRVLAVPLSNQSSGHQDDFSFRLPTPLRQKSSSSPAVDTDMSGSSTVMTSLSKQSSLPMTNFEVDSCSRNGTPDVTRDDILSRARNILETDGHIVGADSLRTLLQLESPVDDVMFVNTITVSNAARALADLVIAAPALVVADMTSRLNLTVQRTRTAKRPTIVKPVSRPPRSKIAPPRVSPGNGSVAAANSSLRSPSGALRSPVGRVEVVTSARRSTTSNKSSPTSPQKHLEANSNIIAELHEKQEKLQLARTPDRGVAWNDIENNVDSGDILEDEEELDQKEWLERRLGRLASTSSRSSQQMETPPTALDSPVPLDSPSPSTTTDSGVIDSIPTDLPGALGKETTKDGRKEGEKKGRGPDHCSDCGLHRTWVGLSILAPVCRRVIVQQDSYALGGVPSRPVDWSEILVRRSIMTSSSSENERATASIICPRCEMGLASAGRVLATLPTSAGLVPDGTRISGEKIRERLAESTDDRMKTVLFGEQRKSVQNGETQTAKTGHNGNGQSTVIPESVPLEEGEEDTAVALAVAPRPSSSASSPKISLSHSSPRPHHAVSPTEREEGNADDPFSWLADIDMKVLLFLCCLSIGYRELLSLLRQAPPPLIHSLLEEDWSALVALSIRDVALKKNPLGHKLISDVLSSVGLSSFLSVEPNQPIRSPHSSVTSCGGGLARRQAPPIYSWIIDCNGVCRICTLRLHTTVAGNDLPVTSFSCGHSYHSQCISTRQYCLACVRARKQLKTTRGGKL